MALCRVRLPLTFFDHRTNRIVLTDSDEQILRIFGSVAQVLAFIEWLQRKMESIQMELDGYNDPYTCALSRADEVKSLLYCVRYSITL